MDTYKTGVVAGDDFAPDIARKQLANSLANVWSAAQMLEFFGHQKWADRLIASIEEMLYEKEVLTPTLVALWKPAKSATRSAKS